MGAPLDLFYRLTQRDLAFPHWGPSSGLISLTGGGGTMQTTLADFDATKRPPDGTILFITNIMAASTPSVGVTPRPLAVRIMNRSTGVIDSVVLEREIGAASTTTLDVQSQVDIALLMDRFYLDARAIFSGGLANILTLSWQGFAVPKGEIGFT